MLDFLMQGHPMPAGYKTETGNMCRHGSQSMQRS